MTGNQKASRPGALKILIALEAVFGVAGFASGIPLVYDSSGKTMGLSLDLLKRTPVGDFFLVGLFFMAFYGLLPLLASYGLLTKKRWTWTDILNKWTGELWGWTASVMVGVILLLWIAFELLTMGFLSGSGGVLQIAMAGLGVVMLALAARSSVRASMRLPT